MVIGVDMVDDELKFECRLSKYMCVLVDWDVFYNFVYVYYVYYVYVNLYTLNVLRVSKGLNIIVFRFYVGEVGDIDYLCIIFMFVKNIVYGLNLCKLSCL